VALISTQTVTPAGLTPALQACNTGGDTWSPTATTMLYVKNGDSVQHTITVHTTATVYGQPISNIAIPVPAGSEIMCGPFDPGMVANPATTVATVTYDTVTSMTIAAIQVPAT
jgi:hypothetical protein